MNLIDLSPTLSINIEFIKAVEKDDDGNSKIYVELDKTTRSVNTDIPFSVLKMLLVSDSKKGTARSVMLEKAMTQLARYQTQPVP